MKKILAAGAVVLLSLLTCSKKSTNPSDDNNPPVRTPFDLGYAADPALAKSALVTAATGGSIAAKDRDSVAFTLTIPPHALAANTTITLTPLSYLHIGGPAGTACSECAAVDSLCCHRGVLIEPSGLGLDSTVTLAVQLPPGKAFPYPNGAMIVYLDSMDDRYEPCYTTYDSAAGHFEAQLNHFSGYGTDDPSYSQHEEAIYQILDEAAEHIDNQVGFFTAMEQLKVEYFWCSGHGDPNAPVYSDLLKVIETQSYDLSVRHVNNQRTRASSSLSCDALVVLDPLWSSIAQFATGFGITYANAADFAALSLAVKSDVVTYFNETAQKGHQLCLMDSCAVGQEQLSCALAHQKAVDDQSLLDTVGNWALACNQCGIDASIYVDKDVVRKIAESPDDIEACLARFTVSVHNNETDEPVANAHVQLIARRASLSNLQGMTNADGYIELIYSGSSYGTDCFAVSGATDSVFAEVSYGNKAYYTDTVSVTFQAPRLETTVAYQYHFAADGEGGFMEEASAVINGTVTGPGYNVQAACPYDSTLFDGSFTRSWSCDYQWTERNEWSSADMIGNPEMKVPVARYRADTLVTIPGSPFRVRAMTAIVVGLGRLQDAFLVRSCGNIAGYADTCSNSVWNVFNCGNWWCVPVPTVPDFISQGGTYQPYMWTLDTLGRTASMTVSVRVVY